MSCKVAVNCALHSSIDRDLGVRIVSGRYRPWHVVAGEIEASVQMKAEVQLPGALRACARQFRSFESFACRRL